MYGKRVADFDIDYEHNRNLQLIQVSSSQCLHIADGKILKNMVFFYI